MFFKKFNNAKGMSLVEILVVVAIIGTIMAFIANKVRGGKAQAQKDLTKAEINKTLDALEHYNLDNDTYPSTVQGLKSLKEMPSSGEAPKNYRPGGYLKKTPTDKWGHKLKYAYPGTHGDDVDIWSVGKDGQEGTEDDINSWDMDGEEDDGGEE